MIQTGLITNTHSDLTTDATHDFYGLRLATCSLDQRIKIWELDQNGTWTVEDDWKAHDAAVSKLSWAHPEFGSIIASGSFDKTVKIWEQVPYSEPSEDNASRSSTRWVERAMLPEARGTVRSVEFAPHHFGLKLAVIGSDNYLRIYDCLQQPSLLTWQPAHEIKVNELSGSKSGTNSRGQTASATPTSTSAPAENLATQNALIHQALLQQASAQLPQPQPQTPRGGNREADGAWCISWCKDRYWGEVIAAGCGSSGVVKIIQLLPSHQQTVLLELDERPAAQRAEVPPPQAVPLNNSAMDTADTQVAPEGRPSPAITSVAWAPSCGRSYHLIATGGRDGKVKIWRVTPGAEEGDAVDPEGEELKWKAKVVADFDTHKAAVGRVEWNITGTVLSSAGNDGRIRLWKTTASNIWRPAGSIGVEQAEEQEPANPDVDMDDSPAA